MKRAFYACSMSRYEARFPWLRDRKFLQELESDSVDSETFNEELYDLGEDVTAYT